MEIGATVPNFTFTTCQQSDQQFNQFQGKAVVLYFYPRDLTPGCTLESEAFRDHLADFAALDTVVLGISRDSLTSHQKFCDKHQLNFELISDPDEQLCTLFDVMRTKNMYGKQVRGIERSTFLINSEGKIAKTWRKVKVAGHVAEVLQAAKTLKTEN